MNSSNETWNELWTLSSRIEKKRIADTYFEEFPGLDWAQKNILETEVGGKELQEDIEYAGQTGQWFGKGQPLGTNWDNTVTALFYQWAYYAVPYVIDITEEQENMTARGAHKLLTQRTKNCVKSARDAISSAFFGAQTGQSMLGLQDIIKTTGSLGGLSRSGRTYLQAKVGTTSTDFDATSAANYAGPAYLNTLYNQASVGNNRVKVILLDETRFGEYQGLLTGTGYARTTLTGAKGMVNPQNPVFNTVEVMFDRDMPSGVAYGLNPNGIHLKIQKGLNFAKTPFRSPHNQLVKVAFVVVAIQLTANNPRLQFSATTLT